jgi:hypothetical protein
MKMASHITHHWRKHVEMHKCGNHDGQPRNTPLLAFLFLSLGLRRVGAKFVPFGPLFAMADTNDMCQAANMSTACSAFGWLLYQLPKVSRWQLQEKKEEIGEEQAQDQVGWRKNKVKSLLYKCVREDWVPPDTDGPWKMMLGNIYNS